jgi:hypothetical protein
MPRPKDTLEPKYEANRAYLVPGGLLNEIIRTLRKIRPIAGPGLLSEEKDDGLLLTVASLSGVGQADCPFGSTYVDGTSTMIRGGVVTGGEGSIVVDDTAIGSVSSPPADGTQVWLEVNFTAATVDDVLMPGGDVTSASIGSGSSIPSNDLPTASSTSGTLHIPLGDWLDDTFRPAGCGNFQIAHCPGTLSYVRG